MRVCSPGLDSLIRYTGCLLLIELQAETRELSADQRLVLIEASVQPAMRQYFLCWPTLIHTDLGIEDKFAGNALSDYNSRLVCRGRVLVLQYR